MNQGKFVSHEWLACPSNKEHWYLGFKFGQMIGPNKMCYK